MSVIPSLSEIEQELGLGPSTDQDVERDSKKTIGLDLDQIKGVVTGEGTDIDLSRKNESDKQGELPDYYDKSAKEILEKKIPEVLEDTTDYRKLAVQQFGPGYSFITDRDSFQNQVFFQSRRGEYIRQYSYYNQLVNILEGRVDVKELLKEQLTQDYPDKSDPEIAEKIQDRLSKLYDGDTLNERGKSYYAQTIQKVKGVVQAIEQEAERKADEDLKSFIEYKSALESKLKDLTIEGIKFDEDFIAYVKNIILTEKHQEESDDINEQVTREIWLAIVSDPKARLEFIRKIDQRGIDYGKSQRMRANFNN